MILHLIGCYLFVAIPQFKSPQFESTKSEHYEFENVSILIKQLFARSMWHNIHNTSDVKSAKFHSDLIFFRFAGFFQKHFNLLSSFGSQN